MVPDLAGAVWRKSRRSNGGGGACVEVAATLGRAAVRDSKNPAGPVLVFTPRAFSAFVGAVRSGRINQG
ncbi:protein of unknown function (DUF397) [Streptoalloteichus tenebrarius]|uniref:DUF397 domain-containing protein n=1 Tax=Streptoalloteichus tenebrarius (strain ATCC 17920 / DSM 40477 / JCM 4838 / CBS 697.72 / NBRC 16177 / NCIMB 11028 / NRRL B-12390 / A12253. 1 / ISP 5477) TaxID=1933 RepID=A0ABT1HRZ5_STRSD|nr:DUF397 domain-containing protein [Streptoalloteichus tenebrarius]MCP2258287.1 protein of unknown function (DUF397) [Streptoalloteichus tenebrarius]BFF04480.1 hypothetical protein GCM10020241_61550 [Streptoalloteichus tenebrarius]